jgi:hypothetical protein
LPNILRDLEQNCEAFNTQFPARQGVEISKNALRRLMKLRQNKGESIKAYIKRTLAIKEEVTHLTYLDLLTESFINGLRDESFQMNVVAYTERGNCDLELAITACKELEPRR